MDLLKYLQARLAALEQSANLTMKPEPRPPGTSIKREHDEIQSTDARKRARSSGGAIEIVDFSDD